MFLKKIIQHLKHKYKREPFAKIKQTNFAYLNMHHNI